MVSWDECPGIAQVCCCHGPMDECPAYSASMLLRWSVGRSYGLRTTIYVLCELEVECSSVALAII